MMILSTRHLLDKVDESILGGAGLPTPAGRCSAVKDFTVRVRHPFFSGVAAALIYLLWAAAAQSGLSSRDTTPLHLSPSPLIILVSMPRETKPPSKLTRFMLTGSRDQSAAAAVLSAASRPTPAKPCQVSTSFPPVSHLQLKCQPTSVLISHLIKLVDLFSNINPFCSQYFHLRVEWTPGLGRPPPLLLLLHCVQSLLKPGIVNIPRQIGFQPEAARERSGNPTL